jgi:hypothetical protein
MRWRQPLPALKSGIWKLENRKAKRRRAFGSGAHFAAIGALALGGCQSPSVIEKRLIGTWLGETSRIELTFTADHKESWRDRRGKGQTIARWHLEGHDIVYTLESPGEEAPAGTTRRERIKKITSEEVIFTDGRSEGRWTRIR